MTDAIALELTQAFLHDCKISTAAATVWFTEVLGISNWNSYPLTREYILKHWPNATFIQNGDILNL